MLLKIILAAGLWPILPIIYWVMKKEIQGNRNIILGVTLPKEHLKEPEVLQAEKQCESRMKRILFVSLAVGIQLLFVPWDSVLITLYVIWFFAALAALLWPFAAGFQTLKALKKEKNWGKEERVILADTNIEEDKKEYGNFRFLPYLLPILFSFAPLVYECIFSYGKEVFWPMVSVLFTLGICTVLMWVCALWIRRTKKEIVSENYAVNMEYNRIRIQNWYRCFLYLAWINTAYTFGIWAYMEADMHRAAGESGLALFLAGTLLYGMLIYVLIFKIYRDIRSRQDKLLLKAGKVFTEDEKNWIWGMFYYNPQDKNFMVNKRVGVGTTCNLATTGGKVLTGIGLGAILLSVAVCAVLIWDEFTPVSLQLSEGQIEAVHHSVEYTVEPEQIETMELLIGECPEMSKMYGTAMDTLCKGVFSVTGFQDCHVLCNPQNNVFIFLKTQDGKRYLFSDRTDEGTLQIYEELTLHGVP